MSFEIGQRIQVRRDVAKRHENDAVQRWAGKLGKIVRRDEDDPDFEWGVRFDEPAFSGYPGFVHWFESCELEEARA